MLEIISLPTSVVMAFHTVLYLAEKGKGLAKAREIASYHNFSVNHLAKVLQVLSRHNIVDAVKGPLGGYRLKANVAELSLLDVYELLEGRMTDKKCFLKKKVCAGACMFQGVLTEAQQKIQDHFKSTTFQYILRGEKDVLLPM